MRSVALALDDRLGGAELVDAAADDLDRLRQRADDAVVDAGVGQRDT